MRTITTVVHLILNFMASIINLQRNNNESSRHTLNDVNFMNLQELSRIYDENFMKL